MDSEASEAMWNAWNYIPAYADLGIFTFLAIVILAYQNSIFSSSDAREKLKFWRAIVGTQAQIGILGLKPYLMIWICPRRSKWLEIPQNGESYKRRVER